MEIKQILINSVDKEASDIFVITGKPICFKAKGIIEMQTEEILTADEVEDIIQEIYRLGNRRIEILQKKGDDDFSFAIPGSGRFRVNAYKQRGSLAAVIRVVRFELPDIKTLNIPPKVMNLSSCKKGLVLVTGPAGSGKSTTLSCIVDKINATRQGHIITLEDPIEFIHRHNKSIVSQREVGVDTKSYITGLKAALREVPDVILLGEMRDLETISTAMTAAETGQLVLSTLHTLGAANTIDRIIDVFPTEQQHQIRVQLSMVLKAVISQQLIPTENGAVAVFEILLINPAMRTMIRDNKIHQIEAMITNLASEGMQTMDSSLLEAYVQGRITKEQAINYSSATETMEKKIKGTEKK